MHGDEDTPRRLNLAVHCGRCPCDPELERTTILRSYTDKTAREIYEVFCIKQRGETRSKRPSGFPGGPSEFLDGPSDFSDGPSGFLMDHRESLMDHQKRLMDRQMRLDGPSEVPDGA